MATYEVSGPGGAVYHIEGPDNADPSAVIQQVVGTHAAKPKVSPTDEMGAGSRFLAGAGSTMIGIGTMASAIGPRLIDPVGTSIDVATGNAPTMSEVYKALSQQKELDAPLMATRAGKVGGVVGNIALTWPLAMVAPGANTLAGAAGAGAVSGLVQPATSALDQVKNVGIGTIAAPIGLLAGRALGVGYNAIKGLVQPFFKSGQDTIAGNALRAYAGSADDAASVAQRLANPPDVLPGVQPTTAELANNAGMSQLERTLRNNPEYMTALTNRNQANRSAMTDALMKIAGTNSDMDAAVAARSATAEPLYEAARKASAPIDNELIALMQRPSMQKAIAQAQQLAAENGETFGLSAVGQTGGQMKVTGSDLQYLKMALQDMSNTGPQTGIGAHEVGAIKSTLGTLQNWIQSNVPELRSADAAFAAASRPINQMEVATQLSNKLQPALADFGNNTRLSAASYANALRNGDALAANATGWKGAQLSQVLSSDQIQTVTQIGQQLARRVNADELGRAVGSNTGQNIVSQNLLRQIMGPMGLPQDFAERVTQSTLAKTILRPAQFVASAGESNVMDRLAEAALNPQVSRELLSKGIDPTIAMQIWARQGILAPVSASLAYSAKQ